MGIGYRIKEARERKNWTQTELAERIGVTGSAITNYENNISHPKESILYKLLDVLEVDANFLFQDEMHSVKPDMLSFFEKDMINKYRKLDKYGKEAVENLLNTESKRIDDFEKQKPLTDTEQEYAKIIYFDTPVSAGTGQYLDNSNYIMLDVMEEPPFGAEFIVRVCGDSMEPTYKDGDKLYIKPQDSIPVGEIGIFSVNSDVYVKERDSDGLVSHNKEYPKIKFNEYDNIKCYGQVVGTCKKYR